MVRARADRTGAPSAVVGERSELFYFNQEYSVETEKIRQARTIILKGLFHPASLARVASWFAFVVAIFMAHENGDKQRLAKRRHVQGMLDETDPLNFILSTFHHIAKTIVCCQIQKT